MNVIALTHPPPPLQFASIFLEKHSGFLRSNKRNNPSEIVFAPPPPAPICAATEFFSKCILPEIVGKCYTQARCGAQAIPPLPISSGDEDEEGSWYYCWQDLEGSTLIGCDNASCTIKWYHVSCLKLREEPEGDLICPTCYRER